MVSLHQELTPIEKGVIIYSYNLLQTSVRTNIIDHLCNDDRRFRTSGPYDDL